MTCWRLVIVHLFGVVGETWAVNIIQDGWPNGPLAAAGMNSVIILWLNTALSWFVICHWNILCLL